MGQLVLQGLETTDVPVLIQHEQQPKLIDVLAKDEVDPGSIPLTGNGEPVQCPQCLSRILVKITQSLFGGTSSWMFMTTWLQVLHDVDQVQLALTQTSVAFVCRGLC